MRKRSQLTVFLILLALYALSAFASYAFFIDIDLLTASSPVPVEMPDMGVSNFVLGLANAGIVLVVYGAVGLAAGVLIRTASSSRTHPLARFPLWAARHAQ